jgi:RNA polymerase sigma factor (sigma-70 family)
MSGLEVEELVKKSVNGDRLATETIIRSIQDKVYSLCLRMLWQKEDAQEACQDILIKVITHLSQFSFESKFDTWVFQIASNHLIDKKRAAATRNALTFTTFEEDLLSEQIEPSLNEVNSPDFQLQLTEIRLSCTTALLQCLDPNHRISYILGEIFELDHVEASQVLGISSSTFRKRLERAREKVESFTKKVCGVISEKGKCQCTRRLSYAKSCGRVDFLNYPFASSSEMKTDVLEFIKKIEQAKKTLMHYRLTRQFRSPEDYSKLLELLGPVNP